MSNSLWIASFILFLIKPSGTVSRNSLQHREMYHYPGSDTLNGISLSRSRRLGIDIGFIKDLKHNMMTFGPEVTSNSVYVKAILPDC